MLAKRGIQAEMCQSIAALCRAIEEGAGTALVAHEALAGDAISRLARTLARQPRWSAFPLVILTGSASSEQPRRIDRKSVGWGKSVSGRVDLGGRRIIKKKKKAKNDKN